MEAINIYDLIKDSVDIVFAFSLKRTRDRYEAEDLSQEIIMNLYSSAESLRDVKAFYGWMWGVAGNVYKAYLRKREKQNNYGLDENTCLPSPELVEDKVVQKEQLGLLYKELSMLSGLYRQTMLLYYMKGKDCQEIAEELHISQDMVKQYLFKSRKKIKEGLSMQRESGEKSFNPRKFLLYFWGQGGNYNAVVFKNRRLPGNIMLEAYYSPVNVEELSIELGVAAAYLEDEVDILVKRELLKLTKSNKLQSNVIIFTKEFEDELYDKVGRIYSDTADYLNQFLKENEESIRAIGFQGSDMNQNTFLWQMATVSLVEALAEKLERETIKTFPAMSNGSSGYQWGIERNHGDLDFEVSFMGYTDKAGNGMSVIDYNKVERKHHELCRSIVGDIILKVAKGACEDFNEYEEDELPGLIQNGYIHNRQGKLSLNFPVYTSKEFIELKEKLEPAINHIYEACKSVLPITEAVLKNHVPPYLHEQLPAIAFVKQLEAFMVNTMSSMYLNRYIDIPKPCRDSLGTFVVLK